MTEPLYDFPCSETFRQHELWWQGEGLYFEPRERFPIEPIAVEPVQDFLLLGRMVYLQHKLEELEKTSHIHQGKRKDKL